MQVFLSLAASSTDTVRADLKKKYYTHTAMSYKNARIAMYNNIDCSSGKLWQQYAGTFYTWTCGGTSIPSSTDVNAEHTVPQSFFNEASPMVSDLHHLFTSSAKTNGARSNYPFKNLDYNTCSKWCRDNACQTTKPSSSIDDWNCVGADKASFMPRAADRGRVARAIFYFYTMYPTEAGDITKVGTIATLKSWNRAYPPDSREKARNEAINKTQGNRNPYVDDYTLVDQAW